MKEVYRTGDNDYDWILFECGGKYRACSVGWNRMYPSGTPNLMTKEQMIRWCCEDSVWHPFNSNNRSYKMIIEYFGEETIALMELAQL